MTGINKALDLSYAEDLRQLRDEFKLVDRKDPASLRRWFDTHEYLGVTDHCRVADISVRALLAWKRKAGIFVKPHKQPPSPPPRRRRVVVMPPGVDVNTWLKDSYAASYSITELADAVGVTYATMKARLKRLKVKMRTPKEALKSTHPCCSKKWLVDNYVMSGFSMLKCSKLAGVDRTAIQTWLISFGIRIRSNHEQNVLNASNMAKPPGLQST